MCEKPLLQERSEQKGSSKSWCGRCKRPLALQPSPFRSAASMRCSSTALSPEREAKSTLPLAITLCTSASRACSNRAQSSVIFTFRPPTLMARSSATYRGMGRFASNPLYG